MRDSEKIDEKVWRGQGVSGEPEVRDAETRLSICGMIGKQDEASAKSPVRRSAGSMGKPRNDWAQNKEGLCEVEEDTEERQMKREQNGFVLFQTYFHPVNLY
jgi:hypothetical protein